jgi:hypothetical protein
MSAVESQMKKCSCIALSQVELNCIFGQQHIAVEREQSLRSVSVEPRQMLQFIDGMLR